MENQMPTKTDNAKPVSIDDEQTVTGIFELLSDQRRRFALHYLATQVGAIDVSDLADQIALMEGNHTQEHYERICTGLVHIHIPKLDDAAVIRYDPERETIELSEQAAVLTPYLDLAAETDLR